MPTWVGEDTGVEDRTCTHPLATEQVPPVTHRPSPFQCGDTLVPAGGSPGREAGTGLPGAMPVPGLMLSLPPALRVPAVIGLGPWRERGDLKAVIKDAKSELSVSLGQRE